MNFLKLTVLLSIVHLSVVIVTFIFFGLGLEGEKSIGHLFLWVLLLPGAFFSGSWIFILSLNSLFWGFCGAVLFKVLVRIRAKSLSY